MTPNSRCQLNEVNSSQILQLSEKYRVLDRINPTFVITHTRTPAMNPSEQSIPQHQSTGLGSLIPSRYEGTAFREHDLREIGSLLGQLTVRQREILQKIIQGVPNKVIAMDLKISQRTVEKHREGIMQRMNVRSLAALVRTIVLYEAYVGTEWPDTSAPNYLSLQQ